MPTPRDPVKAARQRANLRNAPAAPLGNQRGRTHGVYAAIAEAELEAKTRQVFAALAADAPVRDVDGGLPAPDALVVRMLAEVMVRRERVRVEELRHGLETRDGRLRGVVEYGLRLDAQALEYAKELGMTPRSRAALGLDLARTHRSLEAEVAEGAAAWDAIDGEARDA